MRKTLSNTEQAQTLRVRRWYKVNRRGQLVDGYEYDVKQADLPAHVQVHVWTREALTHSREEADYRERHEDEQPADIQWCSGKVMDWSRLPLVTGHLPMSRAHAGGESDNSLSTHHYPCHALLSVTSLTR